MQIKETKVTRLCHEKTILAVNGQFPGPTIYARAGDVVVVNVYNQGNKNITLHWHGVDQPRNPWFDGPEYITQCPIQPGANFTYRIIFSEEEGTLWWHAHSDFDRATVHGAIVVHPKRGSAYPYTKPHKEMPIILGTCMDHLDLFSVLLLWTAIYTNCGTGSEILQSFDLNAWLGILQASGGM